MSVASLVRSAVGGISGNSRWSDAVPQDLATQNLAIQEIEFETGTQTDAESDVEEAMAPQVVLSDKNSEESGNGDHKDDAAEPRGEDGAETTISSSTAHGTSRADGNPEVAWFSVGSEKHMFGACKPCAFFHTLEGCNNGTECEFCHRCPPREKQRRKRVRRRLLREHEEHVQSSARAVMSRNTYTDRRFQSRHSRQGSAGSNFSAMTWESCSTWESASTHDPADYMASLGSAEYAASMCSGMEGTPSRQSSGQTSESCLGSAPEGGYWQPMAPMVQMMPMYELGPTGVQVMDVQPGVATENQASGLGYEYHPELQEAKADTVGSDSEPGSPTPFAESPWASDSPCAAAFPHPVDSVLVEPSETAQTSMASASASMAYTAHGAYGVPSGYTFVPIPHYMPVQQLPTVIHHAPQPSSIYIPMATPSYQKMWRAPVYHQHVRTQGKGGNINKVRSTHGGQVNYESTDAT